MILILKWDPPSISPVIQMTQTQTRLLTAIQLILLIEKVTQNFMILDRFNWNNFGPLCLFEDKILKKTRKAENTRLIEFDRFSKFFFLID